MSTCMSLLGGVWTPEIIWSLSDGQRRFSELRRAMPAVSAKVLSTRLKDLEGRGVLSRTVLPTTPPSVEYALTDLGEEIIPRYPGHRRGGLEAVCADDSGRGRCLAPRGCVIARREAAARAPALDEFASVHSVRHPCPAFGVMLGLAYLCAPRSCATALML